MADAATADVTTATPDSLAATVTSAAGAPVAPYAPFIITIEHGASPKLLKTILIVLAVMGGLKLLLMLISLAFTSRAK